MNNTQKNSISTKQILGIIIKVVAIAASIYGMFRTSFFTGWKGLTYFTNLSNIWIDLILFVFLVLDIRDLKNGTVTKKNNVLYILKYVLTVSITITFLVFMLILAPTQKDGIFVAYFGRGAGSFCVHFLTPVLAILDFFLYDHAYRSKKVHACYAMVPALAYLVAVIILGQCGVRWMDDTMIAPYNFINYGAPTGWFGFDLSQAGPTSLGIGVAYMVPLLCLIFFGLGLLYLRILNGKQDKTKV